MPKPLAICIENLEPQSGEPRFVRCAALVGRQPGLRLDQAGNVLWQPQDGFACELWVSADDCLILYRPEGAPPITVQRAGRSLDVPLGKPVVILHRDFVSLGGRKLKIHVHGVAPTISPPAEVNPQIFGNLSRAAATAVLVGATLAGGCDRIAVRENPPLVVAEPVPPEPGGRAPVTPSDNQATGLSEQPAVKTTNGVRETPLAPLPPPPTKPPIEVRETPPDMREVE